MPVTAFGPQGPNYTTTRPPADPKASGGVDTFFKNCTAAGMKDGTFATADFFNVIISNLRYLCREAGVALDDASDTMVYDAVQSILALGTSQGVYGVDTGAANAAVVAIPAVTSLLEGQYILVKMSYTNTAGATLNVSGLGAKPILAPSGLALGGFEYRAGEIALFAYTGAAWQLVTALSRPPLSANTTVYVNTTTGNDANYDGSSAAVVGTAGPFKTIQRAVNEVFKYSPGPYTLTIQVSAGTYAEAVFTPTYAGANFAINGAGVGLTYVTGATNFDTFYIGGPNSCVITGLTGTTQGGSGPPSLFHAGSGAFLATNNTASGNVASAVWYAEGGGYASVGNHTFNGGSVIGSAFYANQAGRVIPSQGATFTLAGAVTVGAWAIATQNGSVWVPSPSSPAFVNPGNATGSKYSATLNGTINSSGNGTSYFPGTVAGTTSTGGQSI